MVKKKPKRVDHDNLFSGMILKEEHVRDLDRLEKNFRFNELNRVKKSKLTPNHVRELADLKRWLGLS